MPAQSVLVVDDDPTVSEVVVAYLSRAGFDVHTAADGPTGLAKALTGRQDLVVLDLMLPGMDGLEVCRRLRDQAPQIAVVMLTALGDEDDRIVGLQHGADDYLTKPFSPRELVLRVQSVLRRRTPAPTAHDGQPATSPASPDNSSTLVSDDGVVLDLAARSARRSGAPLSLTTREFDLLAFFLAHPGRAFTRDELLAKVWGWEFGDRSTVTVHVRRLREKVEDDPARPRSLSTVWGYGYRWDSSVPGMPSLAGG